MSESPPSPDTFDPYYKWLGIRPTERPITHYRLLGLAPLEDDAEVITDAADRYMAHVRNYQAGKYSDQSQRVLNELSAAKLCLLNKDKKAAYDAQLKPAAAAVPSTPMAADPLADLPDSPGMDVVRIDTRLPKLGQGLPVLLIARGAAVVGLGVLGLVLIVVFRGGSPAVATNPDLGPPSPPPVASIPPLMPMPRAIPLAQPDAPTPEVTPAPVFAPTLPSPTPSATELPVAATTHLTFNHWAYEGGSYKKEGDIWIHHSSDGRVFGRLKEMGRTEEFVELHNENLGNWVRLCPTEVLMSKDGVEWRRYAVGSPAGFEFNDPERFAGQPLTPLNVPPAVTPSLDTPTVPEVTLPVALQPQRAPVPEAIAIGAARKAIRENPLFASGFNARNAEEKVVLARKLLREGEAGIGDEPTRYVLLDEAFNAACDAGAGVIAWHAVDALGRQFEINAVALKKKALSDAARLTRVDKKTIAKMYQTLVEQAVLLDDHDAASALVTAGIAAARKADDHESIAALQARGKELRDIRSEFAKVKASREKLAESPGDAEASLLVGRYLCLVQNKWDEGLPLLAQGSDPVLRDLAKRGLNMPRAVDAQIALGDAWWNEAEKDRLGFKGGLQRRAAHWYQLAEPLAGNSKTRISQRIAETPKLVSAKMFSGVKSLFNGRTLAGWRGTAHWSVQAGVLVGRGGGGEGRISTVDTYQNFVLRLKFRMQGVNSGVIFRKDAEVEICENAKGTVGHLYNVPTAINLPGARAAYRPVAWNELTLTADGPSLIVSLNGVTTATAQSTMASPGPISLQVQNLGQVEFKDLEILPLH